MDVQAQLLKDRICDYRDRIPTHKWPIYSRTLDASNSAGGEIPAGATVSAPLVFEAERDTLFTDLSIRVTDDANAALEADVSLTYCNVTFIEHTDTSEYDYCCARKPIFLVGVRENKRLKFIVTLQAVAPAGGANISLTMTGFQGVGCCD